MAYHIARSGPYENSNAQCRPTQSAKKYPRAKPYTDIDTDTDIDTNIDEHRHNLQCPKPG